MYNRWQKLGKKLICCTAAVAAASTKKTEKERDSPTALRKIGRRNLNFSIQRASHQDRRRRGTRPISLSAWNRRRVKKKGDGRRRREKNLSPMKREVFRWKRGRLCPWGQAREWKGPWARPSSRTSTRDARRYSANGEMVRERKSAAAALPLPSPTHPMFINTGACVRAHPSLY